VKEKGFVFLVGRLLSEIRRFKPWVGVSVALLLVGSGAALAANYLMGTVTDAVLAGRGWPASTLTFLLAAIAVSILFRVLGQYQWGLFFQRISFELRAKTVRKINRVRYAWLEAQSSGDLIVRLNSDLANLLDYYGQFRNIFSAFVLGFLSLILLARINPLLALGYLFFPCLVQYCVYHWSKKMDPLFMKRQRCFGALAASSQDFLNGAPAIKAMGREGAFVARYREKLRVFTDQLILLDKKSNGTDAVLETLGYLQTLSLLILGGVLVFAGNITLGDLLICQLIAPNIGKAVQSLNFFHLRQNLASAFRVFELWDEGESVARQGGAARQDGVARQASSDNSVTLDHVSFAYPQRPGVAVLTDICLSVQAGQKVAIVGPNGSGKTSVFKLITGLYEPGGGSVSLGTGSGGIAVVEQDTVLFSGSFADNISLDGGRAGRDEGALVDSARKAAIHDFIMSACQGYLGDCGAARLSGGQRQRLAIARALYRKPCLILLDEPTSALGRETADGIMDAITRVFSGKTLIMITHNISLVKDFDRIYLMDKGRIVDSGSHEHLLRNDLYSRLAREGGDEHLTA
jgi:ATP-binding cassette subfamily B protein